MEEDPEVCATMERIAHLFLADSGAVEDTNDEIVDEIQ